MEVYLFTITIGMITGLALMGAGILLGKYIREGEFHMDSDSNILPGGRDDIRSGVMGDDNRKVYSGCDMGQDGKTYQPSTEEIISVLHNVRRSCGLSSFEKLCIDKAIAIIDKLVEMLSKLTSEEDDLK